MAEDVFTARFDGSREIDGFMAATFAEVGAGVRAAFIERVDESAFSAGEWAEALRVMGEWLAARGLTLPLRERIGYLTCAADSAGAGGGLEHLPSLVAEMLERHGCERATHAPGA